MIGPPLGSVIDGRYELEALIGEGGMGMVWRAKHRFTGARVALKMLHPHLRLRADLAARFLTEARAPAAIGHPGIVSVTDAGMAETGDPYFAMELLDGEPLAATMRRGPMPFETIRGLCLQILDALGAAHAAGFIHRDLKPENVFVTATGTTKLLDFGIAKSLGELEGASSTATGVAMGTLFYMSPEQLRNAKRVDHRTDLWAVGVMLYQMVSGQLPYEAESLGDMLMLVLSAPPRSLQARLTEVSPELDAVLRRALAVDPAARFASAGEMAQALRQLPSLSLRYQPGVAPGLPAHAVMPTAPQTTASPLTAARTAPAVTATAGPAPPKRAAALVGAALGASGVLVAVLVAVVVVAALGVAGFWRMRAKRSERREPPRGEPAPAAAAGAGACERACRRIAACGAVVEQAECARDCDTKVRTRRCVKDAGESCDSLAACYIEHYCDTRPSGTRSCRDTAACEARCPVNDPTCSCRCMTQIDPAKSTAIVANNSCARVRCNLDCEGPRATIQTCLACFNLRCTAESARCQAN